MVSVPGIQQLLITGTLFRDEHTDSSIYTAVKAKNIYAGIVSP